MRVDAPRVVIAHDYLTQRGGAERVVLDLLRAFPGSRLVTSVWHRGQTFPEFEQYDVQTLWPDKVPLFRADPRRAFPFLARAWEKHLISDADVVVCSSSGWAHRVGTSAPKVVYCHNPARWFYQPDDYLQALPPWARDQFARLTRSLRESDARAAHSASAYLVNSRVVAARVESAYGIRAQIVPPPRGVDPLGEQEPVPGVEPGFLLTVGRSRGYKNTEVVIAAICDLPGERLVCVGERAESDASTTYLTDLSDAQMRWLYANAFALVAVANEDFGLTPVEAQAFGIPTVALRAGGYLDSTLEGVTGVYVDTATPADVAAGVRAARSTGWDAEAIRRAGDRYAPETFRNRVSDVVDQVLRNRAST